MKKIELITAFAILLYNVGQAQSNSVGTLIHRLHTAKNDTNKVNLLYSLSRYYWNVNGDSSIIYGEQSLALARKLNFKKGVALALLVTGVSLEAKGKYPEALKYHLESLNISDAIGLPGLSINTYNNIGVVYSNVGNYPKALYYFNRTLHAQQAGKYSSSAIFPTLVNIGEIFKKNQQPDSAISYNLKALRLAQQGHDSLGVAVTLFNVGDNLIVKKEYSRALTYLQRSVAISKKLNDKEGVAYCNNSIGNVHYHLHHYPISIKYALEGLRGSTLLGNYEIIKSAYNLLYLNYQKLFNYRSALYYRNREVALTDSLNTAEKIKKIKNIQVSYELQKKETEIELLKKEKYVQAIEINDEINRKFIGTFLITLLACTTFFLFRSNSAKKKLNHQLELQKQEVINQNHQLELQRQEVINQNHQLEELNETKNKLFSIISHDLRGPFTSLYLTLSMMKAKELSVEEQEFLLSELGDSLDQSVFLLNNLLYWAKSQMNGMTLMPRALDIRQIITRCRELLQIRVNQKEITLHIKFDERLANIYADEETIEIVIRNLLENAIKYCSKGDEIRVSVTNSYQFLEIAIKDTGSGIPVEDQYKLFNKLVSYTTYGTRQEKGSGLGLLLCKELIEKNNGKIWFTSQPKVGSTFYVALPLFENSTADKVA